MRERTKLQEHVIRMNPWLIVRKPKAAPALRLFCIPYAGGSAGVFARWPNAILPEVEVVAVQLPGRGSRFREAPISSMPQAVGELREAIAAYADRPFVFFGYSMGAHIAFELARSLQRSAISGLQHIILAAERAPHLLKSGGDLHALPKEEFLEHLRRYSGTSELVLQSNELVDAFLPSLRADFAISELYEYVPGHPLRCDATLFGGLTDPHVPHADLEAWRAEIAGDVTCELFSAGHFFINDCSTAVIASVNRILANVLSSLRSRTSPLEESPVCCRGDS